MKGSANPFPFVTLVDTVDPTAPASGTHLLFVDTDEKLKMIDHASLVTDFTPGAGGAVATDTIWDAAGDLVQGTGANTAAKLTLGAAGTVVRSTGSTNAYAYPPGYEFDYAEITSSVTVSATSEATATTCITGAAVSYNGATAVLIEFYAPYVYVDSTNTGVIVLYDGSGSIGKLAYAVSNGDHYLACYGAVRITPSNASHTYSIRAYKWAGNMSVRAEAGGSGADMPAWMRITKV